MSRLKKIAAHNCAVMPRLQRKTRKPAECKLSCLLECSHLQPKGLQQSVSGVCMCVCVCTRVCMRGRIHCCHSQRICIERAWEPHDSHQGSLTSFIRHAESLMGVHWSHTICRIMMPAPYTNQGGNWVWLCAKSHSFRLKCMTFSKE